MERFELLLDHADAAALDAARRRYASLTGRRIPKSTAIRRALHILTDHLSTIDTVDKADAERAALAGVL